MNLQKTPKDRHAALVLHARCDDVMAGVMRHLRRPVPPYVRTDAIVMRHVQPRPGRAAGRGTVKFRVEAGSVHGPRCPLPMVVAAELSFPVTPNTSICLRAPS